MGELIKTHARVASSGARRAVGGQNTGIESNSRCAQIAKTQVATKPLVPAHIGLRQEKAFTVEKHDESAPADEQKANTSLTKSEIVQLAKYFGVHLLETTDHYLVFGHPLPGGSISEVSGILGRLGNAETVLSTEEEELLATYERSVFKFHLQVPEGKKPSVLRRLLYSFKQTNEKGGFEDHRIIQWKVRQDDDPSGRLATFVFYPQRVSKDDPLTTYEQNLEAAKVTGSWLYNVVRDLNLHQVKPPRYSAPVTSLTDKQTSRNLFLVQGDGDYKDYLKRKGGEQRLEQSFDKERGYAVKKDVSPLLNKF